MYLESCLKFISQKMKLKLFVQKKIILVFFVLLDLIQIISVITMYFSPVLYHPP
jgi:hypothetical protein